MSQQQPHQNRGSFNNSASTNRPVSSSHNYNNNRQDGRSLAKTTTTSRTSKSGNNTSPIAVVNTNFQMPLSNGPTILEKNHLYQQQQQQQLQQHEQFGNHVVNRQHYFQFIQQPQMSVQYSNTNVPFQNSANVQQHTNQQQQFQQHANIDNNVNNILLHNHNSSISSSGSVNENNMSPTTQSSSYFQSLPPEQFREMFLKKVFLGEDSSNFEVCKTTSSSGTAQTSPIAIDNNIERVITNPSSPPQQNNNISPHALFPQPNVHNSPVTSPNSLLQMQQQNLLAPNHQHSLNQQQAMNVHNRNAIVNNELLPSLPPQQLENLSEQQLMEYILTWMTSVKTTNQ